MKVFIASLFCVLSLHVSAQKVVPFKDAASSRYGFKDQTGKIIIQPKYGNASDFGSYDPNFSRVDSNGRTGLVNAYGKEIAATKYFSIGQFSDGLAVARMGNNNYGYIDTTGKEVIPLIYNGARDFVNGLAVVTIYDKKDNAKKGIVNKAGKLVVPVKYDELYGFSDGLCLFKLGSKQGFIDQNGNEALSFSKYDQIGYFNHNRAVVSKNEKYGYINRNGKEIIPLKYEMAENFDDEGYGKIRIKEQYFLIDTSGNQKSNAGFNISATVNVAKDRWVVVTSKNLEAKEPVYFLTPQTYGKTPVPFGASITWQIIDDKNNVIKEARTGTGSCAFRVPKDGVYTIQAYYDMNDCTGCRTEDKPKFFTMGYSFNTKL
jgi:hypothetical protein